MDDVIERMAEAWIEPFEHGRTFPDDVRERGRAEIVEKLRRALRAVSDTHRLVPVEPTEEMVGAMKGSFIWEVGMEYAPDYTEADDG